MIQILGLREFVDKRSGEVRLYDSHYKNNWTAPSVIELFRDIDKYIEQVPEDQRWNMFYTVANCGEGKREFFEQHVLPIDIDGIDQTIELSKYVDVVCEELALDQTKIGVVASGNGLHLLIGLATPITSPTYFKENRVYYKGLCGRINFALFQSGLRGKADTTVFSEARILRLPRTINKKPNKDDRKCEILNANIEPLPLNVVTLSNLPEIYEGDHVHPRAFKRFPDPDTVAVQEGCGFLKNCKENQSNIGEPQWYAMMSIVGRLADGNKLIHKYSEGHEGYNPDATDYKIEHALDASGPRTCDNISEFYEGCKDCPHYNKITSPIQIVGKEFVRTKETGFYNIVIKNGMPTTGKPNYDDLLRYYGKQNTHITLEDTEQTFVHNAKYWEEVSRLHLHGFAEECFDPSPSNTMCKEFEQKVKRSHFRSAQFIHVENKLNFDNGVLDLESLDVSPHSSDLGFTYCIPYNYEDSTSCPTFDRFMKDISVGDEKVEQLIVEYMGYCISGIDPKLVQKCAILLGGGSNGKSVLLELMRALVGEQNCSAVGLSNLAKETGRYPLLHKLFNASDETPNDAFINSSVFKSIVSGDTIEVRRLYQNPIMWKCNTKLVFACNALPYTNDFSYGMFRRLLIIPFKQTFSAAKGNLDPFILNKMLGEKSGILNRCLVAFKNLKKRGYVFEESESVLREMEEYKELGDSVFRFINELVDINEKDSDLSIDMAYRCYCAWSDDIRSKPVTYGTFTKRFGTLISTIYPKAEKKRLRKGNARITAYNGVMIHAVSPTM